MKRAAAALVALAAAAPLDHARAAERWTATYSVAAAGIGVMEAVVQVELGPLGYRVESEVRTRGVAAAVVSGRQRTEVEGTWGTAGPVPTRYATEGVWRGQPRRVVMEYPSGGLPRVVAMEPPNQVERRPVPPEMTRGTVDGLSALAWLVREAQRTGSCAGEKRLYDARQVTLISSRPMGTEPVPEGTALRCALESRVLAGSRLDRDEAEAARPQPITAWIASTAPGAPPVPIRVELASRWWGTVTATLTGLRRAT
jgi:hypothetical protein